MQYCCISLCGMSGLKLDEIGITTDKIPNDEREDENSAIIYGTDYDILTGRFAEILEI